MGVLTDKINELERLEEPYKQERERIERAIADTVRSVGQNPAITQIRKNIFTVPASQLTNSPWSPEFHDWTVQAERLLSILHKKPIQQWIPYIRELSEKKSKPGWQAITVDKIVLSKRFLRELLVRL